MCFAWKIQQVQQCHVQRMIWVRFNIPDRLQETTGLGGALENQLARKGTRFTKKNSPAAAFWGADGTGKVSIRRRDFGWQFHVVPGTWSASPLRSP